MRNRLPGLGLAYGDERFQRVLRRWLASFGRELGAEVLYLTVKNCGGIDEDWLVYHILAFSPYARNEAPI